MVKTPASNSAQYVVSYARNQSISASTNLYLCNSNRDILTELTTSRICQSVIISCPELTLGEEYNIYGGDSLLTSFTVNQKITVVGSSSYISNPRGR